MNRTSLRSAAMAAALACPSALAIPVLAAPALAAPALAEPRPGPSPAVVQAIYDCRGLPGAQERLACYDKAAALLGEAERKGDVVVVDREKVRTLRRQTFGLTLPSLAFFGAPKTDEGVERLTLTLRSASSDAEGRWVATSTEGAVWRQSDGTAALSPPHPGSSVAIRRGALGSFFCKVDGQSAVRCVRDR